MQSITPDQLRSARIFLGWTQKELTSHLGISVPTLGKWELTGNHIPENKIQAIKEVFNNQDIEFIEDRGFFKRSSKVRNYSGNKGLRTLFDKMYSELQQNKDLDVCVMGAEEARFFEVLDFADIHTSRMQSLMPKMRVIKGPSQLKNLQSYAEYRITKPIYFESTPVYIYGNKVALISWDPLEGIVIENSAHYRSFKALFEHIWSNANTN